MFDTIIDDKARISSGDIADGEDECPAFDLIGLGFVDARGLRLVGHAVSHSLIQPAINRPYRFIARHAGEQGRDPFDF